MITIGLADSQFYFRKGIVAALTADQTIQLNWETDLDKEMNQLLERSLPQVLLLGTELKGLDIFSFLEQKKLRYPSLKLIIFSASEDLLQAKELLDAGANAILPREPGEDNIVAAINAVAENGIYFNELLSRTLLTRLRRKAPGAPVDTLRFSKNEIRVLELLAEGYKSEEIAQRIFLSRKSVDNIRYQLKIKTEVSSSIGLVAYALRHRLIR
jgi:two-component system response regulator DegU